MKTVYLSIEHFASLTEVDLTPPAGPHVRINIKTRISSINTRSANRLHGCGSAQYTSLRKVFAIVIHCFGVERA